MIQRLEHKIAEKVLDLSHQTIESLEDCYGGAQCLLGPLLDVWVDMETMALKPYMGKMYEKIKTLIVSSLKLSYTAHCVPDEELESLRNRIIENLLEINNQASKSFGARSNIIVLYSDSPTTVRSLFY
jgi:hypothetical protein